MLCPICNCELEPSDLTEYGLAIIDRCPKCSGMWFDRRELDRLDESVWTNAEELAFREVAAERKLDCPRCETPLQSLSPADDRDLEVDRCPACLGFWLDKGELDRMRALVLAADDRATDRLVYASRPAHVSRLRWAMELVKAAFG